MVICHADIGSHALLAITSLHQVPNSGKEVIPVAAMIVVALVAFSAGVTAAVFLMLSIGIRKGDRPERIIGTRNSALDACTRDALGSRTGPNVPVYHPDREDD